MISVGQIAGLVLAGGEGSRMGGVDKGLLPFRGRPLVEHALRRLRSQQGGLIGPLLISANRHLDTYSSFDATVLQDRIDGYAGPLAGMLAGLEHAAAPFLLTVPCDAPLFPLDLAARLAAALDDPQIQIAMAASHDDTLGRLRPQPVFCLLRSELAPDLRTFLDEGGRGVERWMQRHRHAVVRFDQAQDAGAFGNANTPEDLRAMEQCPPTP